MEPSRFLFRLARLYGVELSYVDNAKRVQRASVEALLATLRVLGVELQTPDEAKGLLRERLLWQWFRPIDPVAVIWEGDTPQVPLRLAAGPAQTLDCRLVREDGSELNWQVHTERLPVVRVHRLGKQDFLRLSLPLPASIGPGYHQLTLTVGGTDQQCLVIVAPRQVYSPEVGRQWGLFAPLYAVHRESGWPTGDYGDLCRLLEWVAERGGQFASTLPMLATQWELAADASPYSPATRLFWNEFYLGVDELLAQPGNSAVLAWRQSEQIEAQLAQLRQAPLVDYHGQMQLKRQLLEPLAATYFAQDTPERRSLETDEQHELLREFARFRAVSQRMETAWERWPARLHQGNFTAADFNQADYQYYLYVAWQVQRQLEQVRDRSHACGALWGLDLPLGVSPGGFDTWRWPECFARGAAGGAPPDGFFPDGQNWGFPPMHPHGLRETRYDYFIRVVRRHLDLAGVLRIDHVMGLHRLFWIPDGLEKRDGVYVRYPREELSAIITLESHRQRTLIVGEDLGTVPSAVDEMMQRRRFRGMYVTLFEASSDLDEPLASVPEQVFAGLDTHDTAPFASWWTGLDIDEWQSLGLLAESDVESWRSRRAAVRRAVADYLHRQQLIDEAALDPARILAGLLRLLGRSEAESVQISLEDLWLETLPQNVPGIVDERPNWRRKLRLTLEEIQRSPSVDQLLDVLAAARQEALQMQAQSSAEGTLPQATPLP